MRAALLRRPAPASSSPLELVDLPTPQPGPGEVLIRVRACAVCRTDLQVAEGDLAARHLPIVPGHQAVGEVVATGPGTEGWRIGDRAGVGWLGYACGSCRYCASGRENLCPEARFTGWDRDGGFAEYLTVDARFAFPLPAGFDDIPAAPLLCGGVIGYRSLKLSGIRPGERLGFFGFGASATLAIQVARHWGCRVFVFTRSPAEQERARRLGAEWAGGYDAPAPEPLDAAVTFAPVGRVVIEALRRLDRGGTVTINAIHLDHIPEFNYDWLWLERSIRSVANFTRHDAIEFLALAREIPLHTEFEVYPLSQANEALLALAQGHVRGAAVLDMSG